MEKEYTGTITLGATTPTFDLESEPTAITSLENITAQKVLDATAQFTGAIMQMPPMHSAIKKDGQRLYLAARNGEEVEIDPRPVTIYEFEITNIELPLVHFRVLCSTGTYIRSLANDFGAALGVGGHLSSLRRTKIGSFKVEDAMQIAAFEQHIATLKGETNTKL
jgi:tRNA pseudouridine55 synthase